MKKSGFFFSLHHDALPFPLKLHLLLDDFFPAHLHTKKKNPFPVKHVSWVQLLPSWNESSLYLRSQQNLDDNVAWFKMFAEELEQN